MAVTGAVIRTEAAAVAVAEAEVTIIVEADEGVGLGEAEVVTTGEEEVVGNEDTSLSTMWAPVAGVTMGREGSRIMTTTCPTRMGIMRHSRLLEMEVAVCRMVNECVRWLVETTALVP